MTCVGGREELGRHVECTVTGSITHCSKLVRASAVEAGGLVAVVRNPVSAQFLRENSALADFPTPLKQVGAMRRAWSVPWTTPYMLWPTF